MNDELLATSFATQLDELRRALSASPPATPETGFVLWAIGQSGGDIDFDIEQLDPDTLSTHRGTEAPVLATVGFSLHSQDIRGPGPDRWLAGMQRLMARDAVPADRNSFFFRPLELLGLAVGARAVKAADVSVLDWVRSTIESHADRLTLTSLWPRTLFTMAAQQVGATISSMDLAVPKEQLEVALLIWAYLIDDSLGHTLTSLDVVPLRAQLLQMAAIRQPELHGSAERGVLFIGLRDAVLAAVGGVQVHPSNPALSVIYICRRFPLLVSELHNRHDKRPSFDIADEYDVQDLIRSVLRLSFTDVRPEEWNPSYGGVQSRSDMLLKHERVVIETKMTRKSLGQSEVVKQLIVDKAQYQNHPDCRTLVCFVYDPEHRLVNPEAVELDLSGRDGELETFVVVSPQGL